MRRGDCGAGGAARARFGAAEDHVHLRLVYRAEEESMYHLGKSVGGN